MEAKHETSFRSSGQPGGYISDIFTFLKSKIGSDPARIILYDWFQDNSRRIVELHLRNSEKIPPLIPIRKDGHFKYCYYSLRIHLGETTDNTICNDYDNYIDYNYLIRRMESVWRMREIERYEMARNPYLITSSTGHTVRKIIDHKYIDIKRNVSEGL